jgi:hypothetical protein
MPKCDFCQKKSVIKVSNSFLCLDHAASMTEEGFEPEDLQIYIPYIDEKYKYETP